MTSKKKLWKRLSTISLNEWRMSLKKSTGAMEFHLKSKQMKKMTSPKMKLMNLANWELASAKGDVKSDLSNAKHLTMCGMLFVH